MKIALIQEHTTQDTQQNIHVAINATQKAAHAGANLVAFPQLAFTPYFPQHKRPPAPRPPAETIPGPTTDQFAKLAKEHNLVIVLNLYEQDGPRYYNTSPIIDADGSIAAAPRMIHLIDAPGFHQQDYCDTPTTPPTVANTQAGTIGIAIGHDRHFPEHTRALALQNAQLIIAQTATTTHELPPEILHAELQTAAHQNGCYTALINRVGTEQNHTFAGQSFITTPTGQILTQAPQNEDGTLYADLDYTTIPNSPAKLHLLKNRQPNLYNL